HSEYAVETVIGAHLLQHGYERKAAAGAFGVLSTLRTRTGNRSASTAGTACAPACVRVNRRSGRSARGSLSRCPVQVFRGFHTLLSAALILKLDVAGRV